MNYYVIYQNEFADIDEGIFKSFDSAFSVASEIFFRNFKSEYVEYVENYFYIIENFELNFYNFYNKFSEIEQLKQFFREYKYNNDDKTAKKLENYAFMFFKKYFYYILSVLCNKDMGFLMFPVSIRKCHLIR